MHAKNEDRLHSTAWAWSIIGDVCHVLRFGDVLQSPRIPQSFPPLLPAFAVWYGWRQLPRVGFTGSLRRLLLVHRENYVHQKSSDGCDELLMIARDFTASLARIVSCEIPASG